MHHKDSRSPFILIRQERFSCFNKGRKGCQSVRFKTIFGKGRFETTNPFIEIGITRYLFDSNVLISYFYT